MGVLPGAIVTFRAESRYGGSVNSASGAILSVNTDAFFPLTDEPDDDIPFTITSLNYTQFFSPQFGALVGKIDTLDGPRRSQEVESATSGGGRCPPRTLSSSGTAVWRR